MLLLLLGLAEVFFVLVSRAGGSSADEAVNQAVAGFVVGVGSLNLVFVLTLLLALFAVRRHRREVEDALE